MELLHSGNRDRFALGHASHADWKIASRACLDQLGEVPASAAIGFLYLTDHFAGEVDGILRHFKERTGVRSWVGTVGAGILATGQEYYGEPALAVMIGSFPAESFHVFSTGRDGIERVVGEGRAWLARSEQHFGVVHADPRNPELVELIPRFVAATNGFLVGGLTSSNGAFAQVADSVTEGGLSGVLFSGEVPVVPGLTQGCSPIGPIREVTSCDKNVAIEIDGRSALEVFIEDIGDLLARDLRRIGNYIYAAFPVVGTDRADYVVHNLVGIDPERGLVGVAAPLGKGQSIFFCRRDAESARADLVRMVEDLKRRAESPPRGAVYYSCVARGPNMFGPDSVELEAIQDAFGALPLGGFFCNGEISNDRLYGYTGVLSLFL